jgi:hypothetical protein
MNQMEQAVRGQMKAMPWQFYGRCTSCGDVPVWVTGKRKANVKCIDCWGGTK